VAASAEAAGELDFPGLKASALSRSERAADQIAERCFLLSRNYRPGQMPEHWGNREPPALDIRGRARLLNAQFAARMV